MSRASLAQALTIKKPAGGIETKHTQEEGWHPNKIFATWR